MMKVITEERLDMEYFTEQLAMIWDDEEFPMEIIQQTFKETNENDALNIQAKRFVMHQVIVTYIRSNRFSEWIGHRILKAMDHVWAHPVSPAERGMTAQEKVAYLNQYEVRSIQYLTDGSQNHVYMTIGSCLELIEKELITGQTLIERLGRHWLTDKIAILPDSVYLTDANDTPTIVEYVGRQVRSILDWIVANNALQISDFLTDEDLNEKGFTDIERWVDLAPAEKDFPY